MSKHAEGYLAAKAFLRAITPDGGEVPALVVDPDEQVRYDPNEHTIYLNGVPRGGLPKEILSDLRAYEDHELAESQVSEIPRLFKDRHPDKDAEHPLWGILGGVNDARVDKWQGGRFQGSELNIRRRLTKDLDDLVKTEAKLSRMGDGVPPVPSALGSMARYVAEGLTDWSELHENFPECREAIEAMADAIPDLRSRITGRSSDEEVMSVAESLYEALELPEPPTPPPGPDDEPEEHQSGGGGSGGGGDSDESDEQEDNSGGSGGNSEQEENDEDGGDGDSGEGEDDSDEQEDDESSDGGDNGEDESEESGSDSSGGQESGDSDGQQNGEPGDHGKDQHSQGSDGQGRETLADQESDFEWDPEENMRERVEEGLRSGNHYVVNNDHDVLIPYEDIREPQSWDRQNLADDVNKQAQVLATKLRQAFKTRTTRYRSRREKGEVDPRLVHELAVGRKRVMRKRLPEEDYDAAVALSIDESGSMSGRRIKHAKNLAMVWNEALRRLDIPLHVGGWTNVPVTERVGHSGRSGGARDDKTLEKSLKTSIRGNVPSPVEYLQRSGLGTMEERKSYVNSVGKANKTRDFMGAFMYRTLKDFHHSPTADKTLDNLTVIQPYGTTPTGEGLEETLKHLAKRPERLKVLFLLTDGAPDGGTEHNQYIETVLREAKRRDILVICLAISTSRYSDDLFDHWIDIDSVDHLVEVASRDLVDILRRH